MSPSTSMSLRVTLMVLLLLSSATVIASSLAVGSSLTGVTVTLTVTVAVSCPSLTTQVKLSPPLKLRPGLYTKLSLVPTRVVDPSAPSKQEVTERSSPSTSVTTLTGETVTSPSSAMVSSMLLFATGASLTGVTVTLTMAVSVSAPSVIVHVKLSSPL